MNTNINKSHRAIMNQRNNQPYPMYKVDYYDSKNRLSYTFYDSFVQAVKRFKYEWDRGPSDMVRTDDLNGSCLFIYMKRK